MIIDPLVDDAAPSAVAGCPGIGAMWKGRYDREPIARIRRLLGVITGDLEAALSSGFIGRSYALVFRFLAEAGTLRRLDDLLAAAGTSASHPEWQLDLLDWMKQEIETSGEPHEPVAHLEWAKGLLELGVAQLLPGGDLFGPPPKPDAVHRRCLDADPEAVAKCFLCNLLLKLLLYHLSHVGSEIPEMEGAAPSGLGLASQQMALRAYELRPKTVAPGQWFDHIKANVRLYIAAFLTIRPSGREAA